MTPKIASDELITQYGKWYKELKRSGYRIYFITFKFRQINIPSSQMKDHMMKQVDERFYRVMLPRVERNPRRPSRQRCLPIFVAAPDLPVYKSKRVSITDFYINNGWHVHGMIAFATTLRHPKGFRLKRFMKSNHFFTNDRSPFADISVRRVKYNVGRVMDYTLKQIKRDTSLLDDILVLPRPPGDVTPKDRMTSGPAKTLLW